MVIVTGMSCKAADGLYCPRYDFYKELPSKLIQPHWCLAWPMHMLKPPPFLGELVPSQGA